MVVTDIFKESGFPKANVQLGKVSVDTPVAYEELKSINSKLNAVGFKIINDNKSRLIEQIKKLTIDFVYLKPEELNVNFSEFLSGKLNLDYNYLSTLFSSVEGTTIEKHLINLKIERVKELLVYDEKRNNFV